MSANAAPERVDLDIGGMTCAACASRVERKLNRLDGVQAAVNYATEQASVSYDPAQGSRSESQQSESCCCGSGVRTEKAPATAEPSTSTRRNFSYEPSMNQPSAAGRSYYDPRTQSSKSSPWRHTGSKDERNNYRN